MTHISAVTPQLGYRFCALDLEEGQQNIEICIICAMHACDTKSQQTHRLQPLHGALKKYMRRHPGPPPHAYSSNSLCSTWLEALIGDDLFLAKLWFAQHGRHRATPQYRLNDAVQLTWCVCNRLKVLGKVQRHVVRSIIGCGSHSEVIVHQRTDDDFAQRISGGSSYGQCFPDLS